MSTNRRRVLQVGGFLACAAAAGSPSRFASAQQSAAAGVKRIALMNLHTAERLDVEFFRDGAYVPEALAAIEELLRDFRTAERHAIDPPLMDYLFDVASAIGVDPVYSVISGYRSPRTNEMLRERGSGVARRSLHMEGRAIDVRVAGIDCANLAAHAEALSRGGVGYYRSSDFVHLDTGAFRTWRG